MTNNIVRLNENDLRDIIKESVNKILTELDWKTYMNASRKREKQADDLRRKFRKEYPNSALSAMRNSYDNKSDSLENYAQDVFKKHHGKNGMNHNYEGDSPSFKGRYTLDSYDSDNDFDIKNPTENGYWNGEKAQGIRHYRHGIGIPHKNYGELRDDTFDYAYNNEEGWDGNRLRHHTMNYNKDGERYNPNLSSVGNEISQSKDKDYNDRQDRMAKDMNDYYTGKSKYKKGRGWN